jgi:aspartate aminotransferase
MDVPSQVIYNLLEILHGTVILPTPAWLGYLPQIRFLKKNYHMLPTGDDKKINPQDLEKLSLRLHDRQKILILNNPNNPTKNNDKYSVNFISSSLS